MSQVILSESKSVLAKMLAGENLNVVHKRIATAMIDLKTRTLYLPIWEDMNGDLYDLLGGHEVGHAIYTPEEGWHSATHDKDGKFLGSFKDVLNVVEDARIEKLIKRKYPGLSKSFVLGYKNLYERDFFGIKKLKDLSKLNLLDRINLYAKCGAFLIVPFNDDERTLMSEVSNTETWEQVCELATRIWAKVKSDKKSQVNNMDDLMRELLKQLREENPDDDLEDNDGFTICADDSEEKEDDAADDDDAGTSAPGASKEDEEESEKESDSGNDDSDDDSDDDSNENSDDSSDSGAGENGSSTDDDEPQSITDRVFRNRERDLVTDAVEIFTYTLPKPALDRIIVPQKVFTDNFYEQVDIAKKSYVKNNAPHPITETCSKRFSQNNNRYINLLVKEFEMRKNASQYARTQVARTGELDMSKLHKYKYSNDLFKKIAVVEKGKSHGMIMYVDMSGSMGSMFGATMEQTLILVAFCRKVGIPFDVYGFSDNRSFLDMMIYKKKLSTNFVGRKFDRLSTDNYNISENSFHLVHFISSSLAGNQYRRAFDMMATIALNWHNKIYPRVPFNWESMGLALGGTPFIQAVMASRPMIEKFKVDNKVDITNVIYLTDGDGTSCFSFSDVRGSAIDPKTGKPKIEQYVYMTDPKTKRRVEFKMWGDRGNIYQVAMTQFVRSVTGCKHIGFYVGDSHSVRSSIRAAMGPVDEIKIKAFEKFWRENGYYSMPNIGYDMYYYVKQSSDNLNDNDYDLSGDMSNKKIAKVFSDAQSDKRKHRVLVSKFAQDIAA